MTNLHYQTLALFFALFFTGYMFTSILAVMISAIKNTNRAFNPLFPLMFTSLSWALFYIATR